MDSPDNFYIFLPSNSSFKYFPDNTLTNYKVRLPKPIQLVGEYQVALVECSFVRTWYNVGENDGEMLLQKPDKSQQTLHIKEGYYPDVDSLVNAMNNAIQSALEKMSTNYYELQDLGQQMKELEAKIESLSVLQQINLNQLQSQERELHQHQKKLDNLRKEIVPLESDDALAESIFIGIVSTHDGEISLLQKKGKEANEQDKSTIKKQIDARQHRKDSDIQDWNSKFHDAQKILNEKRENIKKVESAHKLKQEEISRRIAYIDSLNGELAVIQGQLDIKKEGLILAKNRQEKTEQVDREIKFMHDHYAKKISLYLPKGYTIQLGPAMSRMLGFKSTSVVSYLENVTEKDIMTAEYPIDMRNDMNSIYVYCSIVESQYVGDSLVPLLRIIHLTDADGVRVSKTFQEPFYLGTTSKYIDTIEIDIRDVYGDPVRFSSGDVVMNVLHFRRVTEAS